MLGKLGVVVLRSFAWVYYGIPGPLKRTMERGLGFCLRRYRRQVVEANVNRAFPNDPVSQRTVTLEFYTHLAKLLWGMIMVVGPHRRGVQKHVNIRGWEHWEAAHREARSRGTGVVLLAGHLGNWEHVLARAALEMSGERGGLLMVTKRLQWSALHEAYVRGRGTCGLESTYEPKTLKEVLKKLKAGGTVAFALDQYAGPPVCVRVPFFGTWVGTQRAVAALVRRMDTPLVPIYGTVDEKGQAWCVIEPAVPWQKTDDADQDIEANTMRFVATWESLIRRSPSEWLWSHRRFKGDLSDPSPNPVIESVVEDERQTDFKPRSFSDQTPQDPSRASLDATHGSDAFRLRDEQGSRTF